MKLVVVTVMAVFALAAFASASAFAANPAWEVEEGGVAKLLAAGESREITAEANGNQELAATGVTLVCSSVTLAAGATITGGEPGTDKETLVYGGCKVKEKACEARTKGGAVAEQIQTSALKSTLAFETKAAAEASKAPTVTLFEPSEGTTFVEVELKGTECPFIENATIKGTVAVKNLGAESERLITHEIEAPATALTKVFKNPGAVETKVKLTAFGLAAKYVGKSKIKVRNAANTEFIPWAVFN
jgi:hypothetical protein